ncbi:hypothetical protein [Candidatus Liberibacter sp.]|uniref:hypothetical protein n=1 Tax=Candidatus Liberibacter sp. TaxID=34022 RepID=UPI0015F67224|nr:hypothetical protein [Candidatus Liberibacter sp.]MBA5724472.1 hypothetical protein [Candidatus Liberibacter sp.]
MTNTAVKQKSQKENVEVRFAKVETTLPFLATKADLIATKSELQQDIANVRTELSNVRTELKDAINTQTKWFVGFMIPITVGILLKLFIR